MVFLTISLISQIKNNLEFKDLAKFLETGLVHINFNIKQLKHV
jgi:hypothetical protein